MDVIFYVWLTAFTAAGAALGVALPALLRSFGVSQSRAEKVCSVLFNAALWACAFLVLSKTGVIFAAINAVAMTTLFSMGACDAETYEILDGLQLGLLLCGVASAAAYPAAAADKVQGLLLTGGLFLLLYLFCLAAFGREEIGFGDVKTAAFCALACGVAGAFFALAVATLAAILDVYAVKPLLFGKSRVTRLPLDGRPAANEYPFAPYLALGGVCSLLFCPPILSKIVHAVFF